MRIRTQRHYIGSLLGCCIAVGAAIGCTNAPSAALTQLVQARGLSAALLLGLSTAADAGNRAVMADTDQASSKFAREAEHATQAIARDASALAPILRALGYAEESRSLSDFDAKFGKYRALQRTILELAVENTNLKAQHLSFGAAQTAATEFRVALDPILQLEGSDDTWHARALATEAVAALREIQVLQAPHIAEADDAAMTRMQQEMATAEGEARRALAALGGLATPASTRQVTTAAAAALDRFTRINAEIVALSRRNTNVRSLALALGDMRTLTAACEDSLRTLHDALGKRDFAGTR